jgi:hypothetical protein
MYDYSEIRKQDEAKVRTSVISVKGVGLQSEVGWVEGARVGGGRDNNTDE